MSLTITANDVRYRLRGLSSTDLPDAILESLSYIPAADAWASELVGDATLTANQTALIKAAKVAYVARVVVLSAPLSDFVVGPISDKPPKASDKEIIVKTLSAEIEQLMGQAGYPQFPYYISGAGGDDYSDMPDGDNTNIDISLAANDADYPLRIFP